MLLLASAPPGRHRVLDTEAALAQLAAVPPGRLTGSAAGTSVVQLVDPVDANTVTTHLRTAAAAPGPLLVHVCGQLTFDRRQRLPHLTLGRTTQATVRYTALPWHWLAAAFQGRPPGTTTVLVDVVADAGAWPRLAAEPDLLTRELAAGGAAVHGLLGPPPAKRTTAPCGYTKALAELLRTTAHRPGTAALHHDALAATPGLTGHEIPLSALPSLPAAHLAPAVPLAVGDGGAVPAPSGPPVWESFVAEVEVAPAVSQGAAVPLARPEESVGDRGAVPAPPAVSAVPPVRLVKSSDEEPATAGARAGSDAVPAAGEGAVVPPARPGESVGDRDALPAPSGPPVRDVVSAESSVAEADGGPAPDGGATLPPARPGESVGDRDALPAPSGPPVRDVVSAESSVAEADGGPAPDGGATLPPARPGESVGDRDALPAPSGPPVRDVVSAEAGEGAAGPSARPEESPAAEAVPAPVVPSARPGEGGVAAAPAVGLPAGAGAEAGSRAADPIAVAQAYAAEQAAPAPLVVPLPPSVPPGARRGDPHALIRDAARAGRHGEAAAIAAAWEQEALRAGGPGSPDAIHWVEVRADLAMLSGDTARACELWMTAASARLSAGQDAREDAVADAVDRAHHCWTRIADHRRARAVAAELLRLRTRVPGRRPGALQALRQRMELLDTAPDGDPVR
ncbi:hypothetical protein SCATT_50610 [Streptantibioticus cattleyicolor NRRL 8057 = DSM 46488]|uniref:Uncharacterized protein n=1 Tax=Streptantibioticus cattleyicolor (strain ATCC 35852 / DSM 46488 / JCM 4925 / NBRC 14057 / NRRL 8057) TaxID=1003195 RepID=G8X3R0_STREN|nr:hypothetical protein SCATT_50610 [Streptantibioticus cattleyicolor NRRL 8057 = DSM 46488]